MHAASNQLRTEPPQAETFTKRASETATKLQRPEVPDIQPLLAQVPRARLRAYEVPAWWHENVSFFSASVSRSVRRVAGRVWADRGGTSLLRTMYADYFMDALSPADFFLFFDSDALLTYPVTCADLFRDGKPVWYYRSFHLENWDTDLLIPSLLGRPPIGDFMSGFPVLLPRGVFARTRAAISALYNASFPRAVVRLYEDYATCHFVLWGHVLAFDRAVHAVRCAPEPEEQGECRALSAFLRSGHSKSGNIYRHSDFQNVRLKSPSQLRSYILLWIASR